MNVTAAMPVSAVNTEIMGTAAAMDIASTGTGDFNSALKSMITEHNSTDGTRGTRGTRDTGITDITADTGTAAQKAGAAGKNPAKSDITDKQGGYADADFESAELLKKYSGYAQSEIIAMLLSDSADELDTLFDFDEQDHDGFADIISGLSQELSYTNGLLSGRIMTRQEPDSTGAEPTADLIAADSAFPDLSADNSDRAFTVLQIGAGVTNSTDGTDNAEIAVNTGILQSTVKEAGLQTDSSDLGTPDNIADAAPISDQTPITDSANDGTTRMANITDRTYLQLSEATAQTGHSTDIRQNAQTENTVTSDVTPHSNAPQITITAHITADRSENAEIPAGVSVQTEAPEAVQQEQAQSTQAIRHSTVFTRRIEEKTSEAIQLAKHVTGTKSDSDLDARQKVTDKQGAQQSLIGADSRTVKAEMQTLAENKTEAPARMTLNEVYSLISERATAPGKTTFTVILTPESLGRITVKMSSESGRLSVEILTETQSAKQLFEARANELVYNLKQNDVEIQSYKVESDSQLFNQSFDGSSKNPYRQQQNKGGSQDRDEFERLFEEIVSM